MVDRVKICPKCGSTNISFLNKLRNNPTDYCRDCSFGDSGIEGFGLFPQISKDKVAEFRNSLKEKNKL